MTLSLSEVFKNIKVVEDFPKQGIVFRHIAPLLKNTLLFKYAIKQLYSTSNDTYDIICGLDARGFIMATAFQDLTGIPQVMIRKQSKLPGMKYTYEYKKEYGSDILELEYDSIKSGQRVLIVDDLMATAGTLIAAANLVEQAGGIVSGVMVLIEFRDLKNELGLTGRERFRYLYPNTKIYSLFLMDSFNVSEVITKDIDIPVQLRINKFRPTVYPNNQNNNPVLMWHPTMETFAQKMLQVSNLRPSYINWNYFPDGWPNITFEPSVTLINRDLIFVMSIGIKEIFAEQLALLVALPRQLINSLTIIVPYLGPATHERVDYSGQLATVEPLLKILSSAIPMTKTGPPIIRIFDIHALQIRFYTNDAVTMKLMSAIPVLLEYLKTKQEKYVIAYPDDGSYKRFKYFFEDFPQVICSKIREGDIRKIIIREQVNFPEIVPEHVLIIDDLVQSGETLLSCAIALKGLGFKKTSVYATHVIFPNESWKKFTNNDNDKNNDKNIHEFIVTNTNPNVSDKLIGINPFVVLDVQSYLCSELKINCPNIILTETKKKINIYVATTNVVKLASVYEASLMNTSIFPNGNVYEINSVSGISSGVSEQPLGIDETSNGAMNRLSNCIEVIASIIGPVSIEADSIFISIENGLINIADKFGDFPVIKYKIFGECIKMINSSSSTIIIPAEYREYIEQSLSSVNRSVTFGSIIEKKLAQKDWHKFISGKTRKDLIINAMQVEESVSGPSPIPKLKTITVLTQKLNQFGAFIDGKINEVKI
jgi:adenine phosphoribosyltransferase